MSRLVSWREDIRNALWGTCIEVERDANDTSARTLCNRYVALPGPATQGEPSCPDCRELVRIERRVDRDARRRKK